MNEKTEDATGKCIFCNPEIAGKSFYANEQFSAIYNIAPILPGHTLVIPRLHIQSLFELSDAALGEMMVFARKVTSLLNTVFDCDGFDWTIQDGVSAGQTIPHLHLHIIPRKPLDLPEGQDWYGKIEENEHRLIDSERRERLSDQEYIDITARLSDAASELLK